MEKKIWFLGLVLTVLLLFGGVDLNPAPPVDQGEIDEILATRAESTEGDKGIKFYWGLTNKRAKKL
jgi:hypothetical protein